MRPTRIELTKRIKITQTGRLKALVMNVRSLDFTDIYPGTPQNQFETQ